MLSTLHAQRAFPEYGLQCNVNDHGNDNGNGNGNDNGNGNVIANGNAIGKDKGLCYVEKGKILKKMEIHGKL